VIHDAPTHAWRAKAGVEQFKKEGDSFLTPTPDIILQRKNAEFWFHGLSYGH
jgi:hypothetical protein